MKKTITMMAVLVLAGVAMGAQAADRKGMFPIGSAMTANNADGRLDDSIKYYFGKQKTPKVLEKLATDQTSQKTNGFGKSDETACNWAFLSAMLRLEKRAKELGANAVVNIVSNYKNVENSSETEFECHNGGLMAGVALKGDFVRIDAKK